MSKIVKEGDRNRRQGWIYVILGIIIMMCLGTVYSWSVFRLPVEDLYQIGTTQSGFPYMISLAFYSLFMCLTGKYLDRYSPRRIMTIGGIIVSLGWILSTFAANIYILTITYGVIIGAGVGIVYGPPMTAAAKWFPEKKGFVVGLVLVGFGVSPLVTAPLVRKLVEFHGVTNTFLILGISFGIIIPILSMPFRYPKEFKTNSEQIKHNGTEYNTKEMLRSGNFKGLYLSYMIGTMIGLMMIGMTSTIGTGLIHLSQTKVALLMCLFAICNGIGRPVFGLITDKLSSKKAMLISYLLIAFAAMMMLMAKKDSVILFSIAFSIFWFNLGGWLAIAPTSTMALYGTKHYSENYGVVFTAYGIGAVTGVLSSGMILDFLQNFYAIFYLVIGLCIVGILLSQKMLKIYVKL